MSSLSGLVWGRNLRHTMGFRCVPLDSGIRRADSCSVVFAGQRILRTHGHTPTRRFVGGLVSLPRVSESGRGNLMKAIVFTRYGSPDRLQLKEVAKPVPKDDEVLIQVHASSINSWDWEFLNGVPFINRLMFGLLKPKPGKQILGADIAGTVEEVGRKAKRFKPGDEVFGDLWDNWGGFAEYACAQESSLEIKPTHSTFQEAAAVPQAGILALNGIQKAGRLQAGQKVLINGAGGGVGTFAIQLAKLSGTEVTGVDAVHKLDVARSVGADHVIDYTQEDFTKCGEQYDLIIDCQNFRSMFDIKQALTPDGTYAMVGGSMLRVYQLWFLSLCAPLIRETRKLRLVAEGPNKGLPQLKEYLESGKLIPAIDRTYSLSEVPDALHYFGEGLHKGKIVIAVRK
jgi:NADPH:quinone reductase-like Zn-dependent oxidoreductase